MTFLSCKVFFYQSFINDDFKDISIIHGFISRTFLIKMIFSLFATEEILHVAQLGCESAR